jgi:hypothetical protein
LGLSVSMPMPPKCSSKIPVSTVAAAFCKALYVCKLEREHSIERER